MVITKGTVPGGKKMPALWETEKEKECEEAGKRTKMLAVMGVFFCDFYFLAV